MALIVEDGTGVAGAESYASDATATTLLAGELGHDVWAESDAQDRERALRMATRLIDESTRWRGYKTAATNALEWPREYAAKDEHDIQGVDTYFDNDEIPTALIRAVCFFASILIRNPNYLTDLDDGRVSSSTTDVGSKSWDKRRQVDLLPWSVRLALRSLTAGPEIPVRRVA